MAPYLYYLVQNRLNKFIIGFKSYVANSYSYYMLVNFVDNVNLRAFLFESSTTKT